MRHPLRVALLTALAFVPAAARADIQLTFGDGEVSLTAQNATLSQILAEWARVGEVKIVNGERVPGAPMTIELPHTPEGQALDILLRNVGGFVLVARHGTSPTASKYDRILILPTASAPRAVTAPPAASMPQPRPAAPIMRPEQDDPNPTGAQPPRGPAFSPFPQGVPPPPGQVPVPQPPGAMTPPPAPASSGPSPTFGSGVTGSKVPGVINPPPAPITQPNPNQATPQ